VSRRTPHLELAEAGVDDVVDAVDGEGCLGDVCRHDDLAGAVGRRVEDLCLQLRREERVDGQHQDGRHSFPALDQPLADALAGGEDVLLPRHKDEDVALGLREVDLDRLLDGRLEVVLLRHFGVQNVDREGAAWDLEDGHGAKELGEFVGVHRRRRDDELEIAAARDRLFEDPCGGGGDQTR